jgi:SNF2-related domain
MSISRAIYAVLNPPYYLSPYITFYLPSHLIPFLLLVLCPQVWDAIVLDEAHSIRNPFSSTAKTVFALKGRCRIALSGTPIQNHVSTYVLVVSEDCASCSLMPFVIRWVLKAISSQLSLRIST